MVFTDSTLYLIENALVDNLDTSQGNIPLKAVAKNTPVNYWPGRKVPYEFDSSFSAEYKSTALSAMQSISSNTGVRFVPAQEGHINRIKFYKGTTNDSFVGMTGGTQRINIYNNTKGTIMHEILHALGIYHEQSRLDRDSYITIKWDNIISDNWNNFQKYSASYDISSFDFNSIMLYGSYTSDSNFAIDTTEPIITKIDGSTYSANRIYLSSGDITGVTSIYGPPYHKMVVDTEVIQDFSEAGTEIYEAVNTYKVCFYSDESFSIPTTLENPRYVLITEVTQTLGENETINEYKTNRVVCIPAGASEYEVGSHRDYAKYYNAVTYDFNFKSYRIVNYH